MQVATQPELYRYQKGIDNLTGLDADRVFAPVCILNHRYYLEKYPLFYFIVRKDKYCIDPGMERVCLYQEGVINPYLTGNDDPFTLWLTNQPREGKRIEKIYKDMEQLAEEQILRSNLNRKHL